MEAPAAGVRAPRPITPVPGEDEPRDRSIIREQRDGINYKVYGLLVDEDELGVAVTEHDGDCAGVKASVEGVEDGAGHGDSEVELVNGGDVWGDDGYYLTAFYSEGNDN